MSDCINGYQYESRAAWEKAYGPVPDGKFVCHSCDNPKCKNLEHLFLDDNIGNMLDSVRKDRQGKALNWEKARSIRIIRATTGYSYKKIASMFGVSEFCVAQVIRNETWKEAQCL